MHVWKSLSTVLNLVLNTDNGKVQTLLFLCVTRMGSMSASCASAVALHVLLIGGILRNTWDLLFSSKRIAGSLTVV